jgi:hypothetical protein
MTKTSRSGKSFVVTLTLTALAATALLAAPPARGATVSAVCQPLIAAVEKQTSVPMHGYLTTTEGGKTKTSELIYLGDATYINFNGKWRRSPLTAEARQKQKAEAVRQAKELSCKYLRDEAVQGEAAAVYSTHTDTAAGKSSSTIWVSKSRGLPLKLDLDTDVGAGAAGKAHRTMRYEYGHVSAPAGVK